MSDLQVFPLSIPGGIEQSKPSPDETDLEELENFAIFRNRIGMRAPLSTIATIQDDQGTPADVDAILDIAEHEGKLWTLSWSSSQQDVYLHSMQVDGSALTLEAVAYTGIIAKPLMKMVSFEGGTATGGLARLYVFDYNQNVNTVYWNGSTITTLTADLDASSAAESIPFSLMIPFKFHFWGTGFFEGTTNRGEMLRFSQPGLIPGTDPAGGTNPREWFTADHRSVGRRGDKIVALGKAGDRLVVFQKRAINAIYGSGATTWTRQEISDVIGAVGPNAVASVDERVLYFWASDGPYRTDGSSIQYIGSPIRQIAVEVDASENDTRVGYSPDDGLVYFIVSPGGANTYNLALVFDHRRERWMKAQWFVAADTPAEFGALAFLDSVSAPGPAGAPSTLSAVATSDTTMTVSWVNGDTNINTTTTVYRDTSSGFTPNDATNKVGTVGSGATQFLDTGLTACTTYYYKARHLRNSQFSSESNEATDKTWLQEPTSLGLSGLTSGLKITGTNNAVGEDIEIQRSTDGTNWSTLTTLLSQGASFSYDDTTAVNGIVYYYRAFAKPNLTSGSPGADSGYTDFSEFAVTSGSFPTGLSYIGDGTQPATRGIGNDANEGNYLYMTPDTTEEFAITIDAFDSVLSNNQTDEIEMLARVYFPSEVVNRRIGGPAAFIGGTNETNIDGLTGTVYYVSGGSDFQSEVNETVNSTGAVKTTADLQEVEQTGVWGWIRWRVLDSTSTDDYYIKAWYGGIGDEPAGWDASTVGGSKRSSSLGLKMGWFIPFRGDGLGDLRISYLSYTTNPDADSAPDISSGVCDSSEYSAVVSRVAGNASTPPAAPSAFSATANGTTQIDLAWTDNSDNENQFRVERSTDGGTTYSLLVNKSSNITTHSDTGLTSDTEYYYKVRAENGAGNSAYATPDNATTAPDLDAPTNVSASNPTVSTIDLSWVDNAADETGIEVHQSSTGAGGTYSLVSTRPANSTSYTVTGLSATATYHYKLRAVKGATTGAFSSIVSSTTTGSPPGVPGSFTATKNGGSPTSQIDLAWADVSGEQGYEIQRKSGGGSFSTINTPAADATSYNDTGLTAGTTYTYRIRATHSTNGDSDWSSEASDTTDGAPSAPADPSGLSAAGDDADLNGVERSAVDLSWTDNANNEDNYEIERCTGASCTGWAALVTLGANVTSYTDNTVTDAQAANTIYRYRVRATNATGNSNWITSGDVTVEPKVTPLIGTTVDSSYCDGAVPVPSLTVHWTNGGDQTGIEERKIYRSLNGAGYVLVKTFTSSFGSTEWADTGVSFGNSYRYRVEDDYGTTGENTGVFASGNSTVKSPVDPDCGEEI
jgi:fibronectin type 3 domain-containing protein